MTSTTCPRCGFISVKAEGGIKIEGLPADTKLPPLPSSAQPHPVGVCCSPYEIGQKLYWNLDLADPDMPPVQVLFKELVSIEGANFNLVEGKWVQDGRPRAAICAVKIDKKTVHPCHAPILDEVVERDLEVPVENLTAIERWPVLEIA